MSALATDSISYRLPVRQVEDRNSVAAQRLSGWERKRTAAREGDRREDDIVRRIWAAATQGHLSPSYSERGLVLGEISRLCAKFFDEDERNDELDEGADLDALDAKGHVDANQAVLGPAVEAADAALRAARRGRGKAAVA